MKKYLFLLGLYFTLIISCQSQSFNMQEIRDAYLLASYNMKGCDYLQELINKCESNKDPVILGYKIANDLFKSKHYKNPVKKYSVFKNSSNKLDSLIQINPEIIEIRLLRYLVQNNAPSILGYNDNIDVDYKLIMKNIKSIEEELRVFILKTISKS